jgi:hypothetical protein
MKWMIEKAETAEQTVKQLSFVVDPTSPNTYKLTWNWPKGYDYVYVHTSINEPTELSNEQECNLSYVVSKDEYKRSQGCLNVVELGRGQKHIIQVYPVVAVEDEMRIIVKPFDENQSVTILSKKAKIQATITEKKRFFCKKKKVKLTLYSNETDIDKDAICYVKKINGRPADKKDGYYFPILRNVRKGHKEEFTITINKNDNIRVFLSDVEKYGDTIEIVK